MRRRYWLLISLLSLGCSGEGAVLSAARADAELPTLPGLESSEQAARDHPSFERYWYRGKAELNRYALTQSRYGAEHRGDAVLIFVTEDFLKTKQVKFEGKGDAKDAESVLKLNAYRRFYTGVYPYTLMTSVFSPARDAEALPWKLTFTASEWCGQTFMQLNRRGAHFVAEERSYFEAEGDKDSELPLALLEDGLFARIRQAPSSLPTGKLSIVPAAHHVRLDHVPLRVLSAQASLSAEQAGKRTYALRYDTGRTLSITFETRFPRRILSFEETLRLGAPATRAILTRSVLLPYWEKHGPGDGAYREALGLAW